MSEKKSGILTLSAAENYGAVLQCHSLCKYLNDNFSDTEIIDFTPSFIIGRYPLMDINRKSFYGLIKSSIKSILEYPSKKIKRMRFNNFRYKISKYSKKKYVKKYTDDDYDLYIVGSDQVFNLELTQYDKEFFLPRITDRERKVTYAASLGVSKLDLNQRRIIAKGLSGFSNISIREDVGCKLVSEFFTKTEVFQMIDPVFLNSKEYWESIASTRIIKHKYILIYAFAYFEKAYQIAKEYNNRIDIVFISNSIKKTKADVKNVKGVGPREFLSLIRNAELIITDSFHGTAFSIIFNKSFFCIPYSGTESRFTDLLDKFELNNRIVGDKKLTFSQIDYSFVNKKIMDLTDKTRCYFEKVYQE